MAHPRDHQGTVDAWLARVAIGASAPALVALLQSALDVLWRRAQQTLGDVTVRTIVTRVVAVAAGRSPVLRELEVHAEGVSCAPLAHAVARRPGDPGDATIGAAAVRAATRDVLTELLTVLGDLTANAITAALHEALRTVAASDAVPGAVARGRDEETGEAT